MPRKTAAEVAAVKNDATQRAAEVHAAREPAPRTQAPAQAPYVPTVRQHIEGMKDDAPLFGDVAAVPNWCDVIAFGVISQSGPGTIQLHGANATDATWGTETVCLRGGYVRPPEPQPYMHSAVPRKSGYDTRGEIRTELTGPVGPRFPKYVRVVAWAQSHRPHFEADVVIEFRGAK